MHVAQLHRSMSCVAAVPSGRLPPPECKGPTAFAAQAAPSEEEAEQRAAVAALHRVQVGGWGRRGRSAGLCLLVPVATVPLLHGMHIAVR